jgi:hypothetical protein
MLCHVRSTQLSSKRDLATTNDSIYRVLDNVRGRARRH